MASYSDGSLELASLDKDSLLAATASDIESLIFNPSPTLKGELLKPGDAKGEAS